MKRHFLFIILLSSLAALCQNPKICLLKGTVASDDIKSLLLKRIEQDLRFDKIIEIQITNRKFEYAMPLEQPEAFELMPGNSLENGGGPFLPIFLEPGEIALTILSESEFHKTAITGGELNNQYFNYKKQIADRFKTRLQPIYASIDSLSADNQYLTPEMHRLRDELRSADGIKSRDVIFRKIETLTKQRLDKTEAGKTLDARAEVITSERRKFQQDFIDDSPNIVAYYLFLSDLIYDKESVDVALAKKNLELLSTANPGHTYNKLASGLFSSVANIPVSSRFTDFLAPDLNGDEKQLSDLIKGKIALLNLWATWCAPCIVHSRDLLPVYERFKDSGFTVVGVAGEFKNTNRLKDFLAKEKWPWTNLVELDRQNEIWQKYGVNNAGGAIFLIDEYGSIIAINPSAEEVTQELERRLGKKPTEITPNKKPVKN